MYLSSSIDSRKRIHDPARWRFAGILFIALLVLSAGCKKDNPNPPSVTIPLKVWVVLGTQSSDVFDSQGSFDNQGCRLSRADITSYINALNNNSHIFAANFQFTWDGSIDVVRSPRIPIFPGIGQRERRTNVGVAMQDLILTQQKWEPNRINVYFAGWMTPNPNSSLKPNGLTIDPSQMGPSNAHIIINDRAWNSSFGSQVLLSEHVFEHEIAHFILRRGGIAPYNGGEHVPNGSPNILDEPSRSGHRPDIP